MGWKLGLACGMVLLMCLAGPFARAEEKTNAAVMTTLMKGVGSEEKKAVTDGLWAALSEYYTLLPREQVQQAEAEAQAANCNEDDCLVQVREILGVDVVYRLYHVDEGYFNWLYMTRASDKGIEKKDQVCSRCSIQEYRRSMRRLLGYMHKKE